MVSLGAHAQSAHLYAARYVLSCFFFGVCFAFFWCVEAGMKKKNDHDASHRYEGDRVENGVQISFY